MLVLTGNSQAQSTAPVDHFSWGAVPTLVTAGQPFAALVQAGDVSGNFTTNFNGNVTLTMLSPVAPPNVLITEVETITTKRVEISNLSTNLVDLSGWRVVLYDQQSWPLPKVIYTFPAGTLCQALGVFEVRGGGFFPGTYPVFFTGVSLNWSGASANNPVTVLLQDAAGNAIDFFCAADSHPTLISSPAPITSATWNGSAVAANANAAQTYQRFGHANHHNAADWVIAPNNFGAFNPALQTPFVGSLTAAATIPPSIAITNGVWAATVAVTTSGTNAFLRADDGLGHAGDSGLFTATGLPALSLQVPHQAFKATAGLLGQGSLTILQSLATDLTVTLSNSLPGLIVLPSSVTISAGTTNSSFTITNLDDALVEGAQAALILATAPGFTTASDVITNYDRPPVVLSFTASGSVLENSGWVSGKTVRSSKPVATPVAVHLSSSSPNRLQVPDYVIIPAGQSSMNFGFAVLDNSMYDGNQQVTITGSVPGWSSGFAQILIVDNETTNLSMSLPSQANEGSGVLTNVGTIQISAAFPSNLTVSLACDLTNKLQVPANIVLPAGQTSAVFSVTILDDAIADGNQDAHVTASANGFASATRTVTVIDNEPFSFSISALPAAQIAGQPFAVTLSALNKSGTIVTGFSNTVNLSASGMYGSAAVIPAIAGPFINGVWNGVVTIPAPNHSLTMSVSDDLGHSTSTSPFDVIPTQILNLTASDLAYDGLRNKLYAGVVTNLVGNGQCVIPINPATGASGSPIPIGADPSLLALSDDFTYLYASLEVTSTGGVARVNLNSQAVDLRFAVGGVNQYGQSVNYVEDMKVQPGHPHTLVATTKQAGGYDEYMAVYDDSIQRSNVVSPNYYVRTYHLAFANSPDYFYITKPNGIWINSITPAGATFLQEIAGSQYGSDMVFAGGYLYTTAGQIFSTNDFSLLGSFPVNGPVIPDPLQKRVYFLTQNGALTTFCAFDQATLRSLASLNLPNVSGQIASFVSCASNRFAFRTTGGQVCLVDTSFFFTDSISDLSVSMTASPLQPMLGSNLLYSITVSNRGPATSRGVILTNQIPAGSSFVSASSTMGLCSYAGGVVSCALGDLTNGATAIVTIIVQPTIPGLFLDSVAVDGTTPDLIQTNNSVIDIRNVLFNAASSPVTAVTLPNNDIVFDPATQSIYASVPSTPYGMSNSVVALYPFTGQIGTPVPIGRQPSKLAIARAGSDLYVGLDGDAAVRRFNTVTHTLYPPFSIDPDNIAYDMDVLPGAPQTVAVSRYIPLGQSFNKAVVYDNGVPRPTSVTSGGIKFSPDGQTLYGNGWDGNSLPNTSGDAFFVNQVQSDGLHTTAQWSPHYFIGVGVDVADGLAYYANGSVLDIATFSYLPRFSGIVYSPLVRTDGSTNRIFFLFNDGSNWVLKQFDRISYAMVGSLTIPGVLGSPNRLISWGTNGIAFGTSSNQIFLVQIPMIPGVPQLTVTQNVAPLSGTVGSNQTYTVVVTNRGPGTAQNTVLTDILPNGAVYVSASASQGSITQSQGIVTFTLGTMTNGASAVATITAAPGIGGFNLNTNWVSADLLDNSSGQSASALFNWVDYGSTPSQVSEIFSLPASDIIYNPSNQTIVASVTGPIGSVSNSLVTIDAHTGSLLSQLALGNIPGQLALTGDSQYLYAALLNTNAVSRISLPANSLGFTFPVGPDTSFGVGDMQAVPGQPHALAVSLNQFYYNSSVTIYDDGVARPNSVPPTAFTSTYPIRFGASAATLYSTLPFDFRTISIDASGAQLIDENSQMVPGYSTGFEFDSGRIYFQSGRVIDPVSKTIVGNLPLSGLVAPDAGNGRVYFATTSGYAPFNYQVTFHAFNLVTSNELWSVPFPAGLGSPLRLIKLGTNGLAVITDAGHLFVVPSSQIAQPAVDLSIAQTISPNPVIVSSNLTCTLTIQNWGPWTASGIVVSNPLPVGAGFVSATSSQGTCTFTNGSVVCALGSLINQASATVTVKISPSVVGSITNIATVTQNELDSIPTNNSAMASATVNAQPALPSVSIADTTVLQSTSKATVTFTLTLSSIAAKTVTVGYQTANGTALAGQDYDTASGVVTFSSGFSRQLSLSIILTNPAVAPATYFYLNLLTVTNASLARTQAVATIVEQIFRTISVSAVSVIEGNSGVTNAVFKLGLSSTSAVPISVQYQTTDGSATGGSDYLARAGTLTIPAGTTNVSLSVPVLGDTLVESNETFSVLLAQPQNAILGSNEALGIIINDDAFPAVAITGIQWIGANVWVRFNTIQGRFYRVDRSDDLATGVWAPVANQIPGSGGLVTVPDAYAASHSARFYRLVLLP